MGKDANKIGDTRSVPEEHVVSDFFIELALFGGPYYFISTADGNFIIFAFGVVKVFCDEFIVFRIFI